MVKATRATETHEPAQPLPGWPGSHASATGATRGRHELVRVELTGEDHGECLCVRVGLVRHYLHTTTASHLRREVHHAVASAPADGGATVVVHGTTHALDRESAQELASALDRELAAWLDASRPQRTLLGVADADVVEPCDCPVCADREEQE